MPVDAIVTACRKWKIILGLLLVPSVLGAVDAQPFTFQHEKELDLIIPKGEAGEIAIDSSQFSTISITPVENDVYFFGASFQRRYFDTDFGHLSPLIPVSNNAVELSARYQLPITDSWSGYAAGNYAQLQAGDPRLSDGHSMIASAGASYALNPKLKFSFGLLSNTSLFARSRVMPFVGIDWSITENLKLKTLNGAFLYYDVGESTQLDLGFEYRDQILEVKNYQGTVFLQADPLVSIEESSLVGTLGVKHNWKDVFSIRAFAEYVDSREYEIEKKVPDFVAPKKTDSTLSFGVEGGIRF
jgi:hypothetical protein